MLKVNIHEAKTHLSRYLARLAAGESLVLCNRNVPVAEIRSLPARRATRRPEGRSPGDFDVPQAFSEPTVYRTSPRPRRDGGESMQQANFLLPGELLDELRRAVPRGQQSRVVGEALRNELKRLRFRQAVRGGFGAWKASAHPELSRGTRRFVRALRRSSRRTRPGP